MWTLLLPLYFIISYASNCVANSEVKKGCEIDSCNTIPDEKCEDWISDIRVNGFSLPTFCVGVYPCKLLPTGKRNKASPATAKTAPNAKSQPQQPRRPIMDPGNQCPEIPFETCTCENWHKGHCVGFQGEELECMQIDDGQVDLRRNMACISEPNKEWCCGTDDVSMKARKGQLGPGEGKDKYKGYYDETVRKTKSRTPIKPAMKRVSAAASTVTSIQIKAGMLLVCLVLLLLHAYSNHIPKIMNFLTKRSRTGNQSHLMEKLCDEEL